MTEIQAVYERHSVRAYRNQKIEPQKQAQLRELIAAINQESGLHFQFLADAGKTFGRLLSKAMGLGSAPSVIACVGRNTEDLDEKIGYYGEKIVLAAQTMGLNTCWAGTFSKENTPAQIGAEEKIVIVIAIGYGANPGRVRRSKKAEQVSNVAANSPEWFAYGVELALLAPTAVNQQKFEITLNPDETVSIRDQGGVLSKIDLGIVKYHFELGVKEKRK